MVDDKRSSDSPRVFISYSWDSDEHRLWVQSLAEELRKCGIDARLDAWKPEDQSIDNFMMVELELADYVIAICTPEFKRKNLDNAMGEQGTASGIEMGTAAAIRRFSGRPIIPVLRSGQWTDAAPNHMLSDRYYDLSGANARAEFASLRDRLLGHSAKPPELGQKSAPSEAPALPDIFADSSSAVTPLSTKAVKTDNSLSKTERQSAPQPETLRAEPEPEKKSGKMKWVAAIGGFIVVAFIFLVIDSEEAAYQDPQQAYQDEETEYDGEGAASDDPQTAYQEESTNYEEEATYEDPQTVYQDQGTDYQEEQAFASESQVLAESASEQAENDAPQVYETDVWLFYPQSFNLNCVIFKDTTGGERVFFGIDSNSSGVFHAYGGVWNQRSVVPGKQVLIQRSFDDEQGYNLQAWEQQWNGMNGVSFFTSRIILDSFFYADDTGYQNRNLNLYDENVKMVIDLTGVEDQEQAQKDCIAQLPI